MVEPLSASLSPPCFPLAFLPPFSISLLWTRFQKRFHQAGRDLKDELLQPLHLRFWRWGGGGSRQGKGVVAGHTTTSLGQAEVRTHFLFLPIHQSFHWPSFVGPYKQPALSSICPWALSLSAKKSVYSPWRIERSEPSIKANPHLLQHSAADKTII